MRSMTCLFAAILWTWSLGLAIPVGAATPATEPDVTALSIDLADVGQPFRGWGTSLAWWAHGVGAWPDEPLDRVVKLVTDPEHGLGLSVFRYNIGGGTTRRIITCADGATCRGSSSPQPRRTTSTPTRANAACS
jgi:hypothetical protein